MLQLMQKRRSSAPEAGNRSKNMVIIQKLSVAFIGAVCMILSACSSPEKDGIKAAKMRYEIRVDISKKENAIRKEQLEKTIEAYELYIEKFDSYAFVTRVDARQKLDELLESSRQQLEESNKKLQKEVVEAEKKYSEAYEKLESKYATDEEDMKKFNYARDHYKPEDGADWGEDLSGLENKSREDYEKIQSLIASVIPPKPDAERLKKDIVGKNVGTIRIPSLEEMKEFEILKVEEADRGEYGKFVYFTVHMRFPYTYRSWGRSFARECDGIVSVSYQLKDNFNDWSFGGFKVIR